MHGEVISGDIATCRSHRRGEARSSSASSASGHHNLNSSPPSIVPISLVSEDEDSGFDLLRPLDPEHFQLHPTIFQPLSHNQSQASPSLLRRLSVEQAGEDSNGAGGEVVGGIQILPSHSISIKRYSSSAHASSSAGQSGFSDHLNEMLYSQQQAGGSRPGSASSAPGTSAQGGAEEHRCDICNKSFTLRTNLTAHKRLHFGETGCPFCEKILSTVGNLRMHIANVHNGNALCPPRRNYMKRNFM